MPDSSNSSTSSRRKKINSAQRLSSFLKSLRATEGINLFSILPISVGVTTPTHIGDPNWASIRAVGLVGEMISDLDREVEESRFELEDKAFYRKCLSGICEALSPATFHHHWRDGRLKITDVDLERLDHLDRVLRQSITEHSLEQAVFVELLASIDQALDTITASELPAQLKDFIATQLLNVKNSIDHYKYRGMRGIQESLAGYCGSLALIAPTIDEKVSSEGKKKLMEVVNLGNSLATLAHGPVWAAPHLAAAGGFIAQLLIS